MTLEPLFNASPAIQLHVAAVIPAALIGAFLLLRRHKGSPAHRLLGRIWLVLMAVSALSSFFIHELNMWRGFSPIHLLSIAVLAGVVRAWQTARAGRIVAHRRIVTALYVGGILVAGGFTLLPYRIMHTVVFDGSSLAQLLLLLVIVVLPWLLLAVVQHSLRGRTGRRARLLS